MPNYAEDGPDSEIYEDDEIQPAYYVDPGAEYKEEEDDEIDAVLTHMRDEDRLADPADLWFENIVSFNLYIVIATNLNMGT